MALVYEYVFEGHDPAHKAVAHLQGVMDATHAIAVERADIAKALLAEHFHSGNAEITIERGPTNDRPMDTVVWLSDERGQRAALSIEYGRPRKGDMEGLHILGRAFGI